MPALSPDGQSIVYVVNFGDILIADIDGSNIRYLGTGFRPSWSPDSRRVIYFAEGENEARADIYEITVENAMIRNLSQHYANDFDPSWSPDGKWIAFASEREGSPNIYVMPDCGDDDFAPCIQAAEAITHNRDRNIAPAWSPDSRQIAFTSIRAEHAEIFVVNRDGSDLHRITGGGSNNRLPAWRPG